MSFEKEIAKKFIEDEFSKTMCQKLENGKIDNKDLVDYVLKNKAWNDTIIYERKKKGSPVLKKKDKVFEALFDGLLNLNEHSDYQSWHKVTLNNLSENYFENKFGMAQKFLNMSIKYLFFLELVYNIKLENVTALKLFKEDFDVPIDSFILKWLAYNSIGDEEFVKRANEITGWNKMKSNIYDFLQDKIKQLLKNIYGETSSVLVAETIVWSEIKDLKSKIDMEI